MASKKNIIIKTKSKAALNEAVQEDQSTGEKKYVFSGCFTQCSVPGEIHINRNERIYLEKTVLPHLGYLREKIQNEGGLLGELDHPEERMDISLKEVSHKITDLYYDDTTHRVMGKLELLNTPNGKIAQELVEAGMPIFVSSRAAGQADEKTHEVEIYQIFTYDIVCNPGFIEARLDRVNESKYPNAHQYLLENKNLFKFTPINENKKYGITDKNISIIETNENIIDENMATQKYNKSALTKPLLEDEKQDKDAEQAKMEKAKETLGLGTPSLDPSEVKSNESDGEKKPYTADDILNDAEEPGKEDRSEDIIDIKVNDEDTASTDNSEREGDIVDIVPSYDESSDSDSKKDEDTKKEESTDEDNKANESDEDGDITECGDAPLECDKAQKENKKEVDLQVSNNDALLKSLKKKTKVKESIIQAYPFTISLSESNFAKFANLNKEDKMKCMNFIVEHKIYDVKSINELWNSPLIMEKKMQQNWLRLADPEDLELYKKASLQEQDAIENSAKFLILETKADVDEFWERTGLRERESQRIINEENMSRYNDIVNPVDYSEEDMGYGFRVIQMVEDAMTDK